MSDGWIKLHRKLSDNYIWLCEPFTRGQAWVDMLLLANHDKSIFYKRGNKVEIERGQLGRSEVELSDRWKWSRTKVRKFLNDLEKEQQIIQHKSTITLVVTILNYDIYQEKEQQIIQQKNSRKTAEEQQKNTYKNEKNDNNEKKFNFKQSLIVLGVSEKVISDWLAVRKGKKAVNTETALDAIKQQIELSGLTANECIKIASENSWSGFKAKWLENLNNSNNINAKKQLSSQMDLSQMNYNVKP